MDKNQAYIWKHTKYDGLLPITNFQPGLSENDKGKDSKGKTDIQKTTLTSFAESGKQTKTIIHHNKVEDTKPNSDHQSSHDEEQEGETQIIDTYVLLTDTQKFVFVKSKIDDGLYTVTDGSEEQVVELTEDSYTTRVSIKARVVLGEDKKQTVEINVGVNEQLVRVAEIIADLVGETKYTISLFNGGKLINTNSTVAQL